ncbi:hypothetical protein [Duganella sp. P38]|uniref:hypothetical protein n=1 Tax=Duganella sp. P38 TaxID=3423949 RepID=UPI003D7BF7C7
MPDLRGGRTLLPSSSGLAALLHLVQAVQRTDMGADQRANHRPHRPGDGHRRGAGHGAGDSAGSPALHHALVALPCARRFIVIAAQLMQVMLARRVDVKGTDARGREAGA